MKNEFVKHQFYGIFPKSCGSKIRNFQIHSARDLLSDFFDKNFVKMTSLLKSWFDEIFFDEMRVNISFYHTVNNCFTLNKNSVKSRQKRYYALPKSHMLFSRNLFLVRVKSISLWKIQKFALTKKYFVKSTL